MRFIIMNHQEWENKIEITNKGCFSSCYSTGTTCELKIDEANRFLYWIANTYEKYSLTTESWCSVVNPVKFTYIKIKPSYDLILNSKIIFWPCRYGLLTMIMLIQIIPCFGN